MGRTTKIAFWVGALILGVAIAAVTSGHSFQFGPDKTLKQYMQEVVAQGTLGDIAKKLADQSAGKFGQGFDSGGFQRDMEACLHGRIDAWLNGHDPRRDNKVNKDDVDDLAGKITTSCLADLTKKAP